MFFTDELEKQVTLKQFGHFSRKKPEHMTYIH